MATAALLSASLLMPLAADATKVRLVSGLTGTQDSKSKELLALSPAVADQVARRDLLSVLQSTGKFTLDNSRNVEGMTFTTVPYQTAYRYVCREDRVTLRYQFEARYNEAGVWLDNQRQPAGVEAQPAYHIEQLPVPGFEPGTSYRATVCDARNPGPTASWFAAQSDRDAVRAANMFRMAEDEVKAGRLTPGPCDPHGADTCRQWILSLDDLSKVESVEKREITPAEITSWRRGTVEEWANQTFRVAGEEIYSKLPGAGGTVAPVVLPAEYARVEAGIAGTQLERAGVRLAGVLNESLK
ncbi:MAG: hypothetical protein ACREHV_08925 [Rhizomicrobium sp.]